MGDKIAVGIDLGGTNMKVGLVDSDGVVLERLEEPVKPHYQAEDVLLRLFKLTRDILTKVGLDKSAVEGVGMGSPGLVNVREGIVPWCPGKLPGWEKLPLRDRLEDLFDCPVYIDNDVNVITRGEAWRGAGRGVENLVCLAIGTGLGGGIVVDGKLLVGGHYSAANIGHMVVAADGPLCMCGNRGCLETFVSGPAIAGRAIDHLLRGVESSMRSMVNGNLSLLDARVVADAARAGDSLACRIIRETAFYLANGILSLAHILDPQLFIIAGKVAQCGDILFEPVREMVNRGILRLSDEKVAIVPAKLGGDAGIIGGASMVFGFLGIKDLVGERR